MGFLLSTISAVTELGVTAAVYTFIFSAFYKDVFRGKLIAFALTYEVLVNIAYMTHSLISGPSGAAYSEGFTRFLAFHGILSLVMFIGLVAMSIAAIREHKRGLNLFRQNPGLMWTFVGLWAVSVITGEMVYLMIYF